MDLSTFTNMRDVCETLSKGNPKQIKNIDLKELERKKNPDFFHLAVAVKEDSAVISITYQKGADRDVICQLYDPEDTLVAEQAMTAGEATILLDKAQLWSPQDPCLYTLLIITGAETFYYQSGIYEQTVEDGELFVNHMRYPIVGIRGCDTAATESAPLSEANIRLQMIRMRENGINTIFLDREYPCWISEIAEEEGMLLLRKGEIEIPNVPSWKEYYQILEQVDGIYESLKQLLWTQS